MYRNEVELAGKKMIGIRHMVECVGSRISWRRQTGKFSEFTVSYCTSATIAEFRINRVPGVG